MRSRTHSPSRCLRPGVLRWVLATLAVAAGCSSDDHVMRADDAGRLSDSAGDGGNAGTVGTGGNTSAPRRRDGGGRDGGSSKHIDASIVDAGSNGGVHTERAKDAAHTDAGAHLDAAPNVSDAANKGDAGDAQCVPFTMPADCTTPSGSPLPAELRCTGLYGDWDSRRIACGAVEYTPAYTLYSDGAKKRRFVSIPPGARIDASDLDAFVFPVGAQFWKEFRVPVEGRDVLAETRLLRKTARGWVYTTYVWSEDASTAIQQNDGVTDFRGTGYGIPSRQGCLDCHGGRTDYVLGWDGILLGDGAKGLSAAQLDAWGVSGDAGALHDAIPGDATERAALGYLHANCGVSCHNPTDGARARDTGLYFRLDRSTLANVSTTSAVATGCNHVPSPNAVLDGLELPDAGDMFDIRPGDPSRSLVVLRMGIRGTAAQMPRIGTNKVDADGVSLVSAWIAGMTPGNGYPAPLP